MAKAKRKYPNYVIESAARATLEAVKRFIAENPGVLKEGGADDDDVQVLRSAGDGGCAGQQ